MQLSVEGIYNDGRIQPSDPTALSAIPNGQTVRVTVDVNESEQGEESSNQTQSESPQVTIDRVDLGTGWVCFKAGESKPAPDILPSLLSHSLSTWLERNPEFQVRAASPITVDGNTIAIHVWFD